MVIKAENIPEEIRKACRLKRQKVHVSIPDASYVTPNKRWVKQNFYNWYKTTLEGWDIYRWKQSHDCDNKAGLFKELADVCYGTHTKNVSKKGAESLAISDFWYIPEGSTTGHCINMVISGAEEGCEVWWIEPQTGKEVKLSLKEKRSVWEIRF